MKLIGTSTLRRYTRIRKAAEAAGREPDFLMLSAVADLALELEGDAPDQESVRELCARLGLDPEALP